MLNLCRTYLGCTGRFLEEDSLKSWRQIDRVDMIWLFKASHHPPFHANGHEIPTPGVRTPGFGVATGHSRNLSRCLCTAWEVVMRSLIHPKSGIELVKRSKWLDLEETGSQVNIASIDNPEALPAPLECSPEHKWITTSECLGCCKMRNSLLERTAAGFSRDSQISKTGSAFKTLRGKCRRTLFRGSSLESRASTFMLKLEHCRLKSTHKSNIECFGNLLHVHVCCSHVVLVYSTCKNLCLHSL